MRIEPLDEAGLSTVSLLAHRIWPAAYAGILTPAQIDNLLSRIYSPENLRREWVDGHRFWLAHDDEPVGYASAYRDDGIVWLKKLYVLPQCQGRGIGRALMEAATAAFMPARELRLLVNSGNLPAQRFYERQGFARLAEMPVRMGDFEFVDYVYGRVLG